MKPFANREHALTSLATLWKTVAHLSKAEEMEFKKWTFPAESSCNVMIAWSRTGWPGKFIACPGVQNAMAGFDGPDCCIPSAKMLTGFATVFWGTGDNGFSRLINCRATTRQRISYARDAFADSCGCTHIGLGALSEIQFPGFPLDFQTVRAGRAVARANQRNQNTIVVYYFVSHVILARLQRLLRANDPYIWVLAEGPFYGAKWCCHNNTTSKGFWMKTKRQFQIFWAFVKNKTRNKPKKRELLELSLSIWAEHWSCGAHTGGGVRVGAKIQVFSSVLFGLRVWTSHFWDFGLIWSVRRRC